MSRSIGVRRSTQVGAAILAAALTALPSSFARGQDQSDPPPPPPPADAPRRPNLPPQPQPQPLPGDQQPGPQFRLPPGVEFVPNVVYAVAEERQARVQAASQTPSPPPSLPERNESPEREAEGAGRALLLNAFFPKESGDEPLPAIIYIHGGGFTGGSRAVGNQYSALLAAGGYFAVTIDYRLLGEAPFPAAIHDCKAAVRFLRANAEELGIDPARIGVWGHSAGGHLAAFLGTAGNAPETHGEVGEFADADPAVACVVDFFGPSDFNSLRQTRGNNGEIRIFGPGPIEDGARKLDEASPIHWVDAGDPPFLIIHGTADRVVPLEQSEKLHERLVGAGVSSEFIPVEGAGHGVREPEVLLKAVEFFDHHLGGSAAAAFERIQQRAADEN